MKHIIFPNKEAAGQLVRIDPHYNDKLYGFSVHPELYDNSEDKYLEWVITRNKENGVMPCSTQAECDTLLAKWRIANPNSEHKNRKPYFNGDTYSIVDEANLPGGKVNFENDYFLEAWELVDSNIVVNMPKARNIHMNQIRIMRNIELEKKDVDMLRALESGNTGAQATISTEKQTLRDIPATFDLTTDTTEELKNKWPDGLPKE